MKVLKIIAGGVAILLVVVAIAAPIGPMPGFFIGGTPGAAPAVWPDTSGTHEIKLRVPGTPPRVVIIWVVDVAGELHVVGAPDSGWVTRIGAGSPVEMRLGEVTYSLSATPVTEGWLPVLKAYLAKYEPDYPDIVSGFPSVEEAEGQYAVFRLDRT
jgi:hypothetical protein